MTPSNWSMNGPGCCCPTSPHSVHPCACYSFDNTPNNSSWNGLHLTPEYPSYSATEKKLGTHAGQFSGSANYQHPHVDCFSPSVGSKPWRVWFWMKVITEPTVTAAGHHGVITKGNLNSAYPPMTFDGEWGVFYKPGTVSSPELFFVYKSDTVALGFFAGVGLILNNWYFFHWQINATTKAASLEGWNATTGSALSGLGPSAVTGNMSADATHPMRIGRNAGAGGFILGANSGSIIIDNVGFSEDSGSAATLYNSGTGLACPAKG